MPERLGEDDLNASFVYRDPTTQQVHFDVVQGKNDGTHLAFTSRVVHPTTGLPVLEQLIAKPATDLSEGIIDWRHDSPFGDLLHFTGGPNMGVGAAMIAIGSDAAKAGSIGLFYNGKGGTDTGMVGVKLINNSTINEATTAYALEIVQNSSTSPTMHVQQANNTATAVRLQAAGAITPTNQALLEILAAGGTRAVIRSKTGEYYSLADVITHDGGGFLNVASGLSIDSHMTKQLSDGFNIRAYSGSPGIYYPGRISRSSAGLKLDVAPNTSSGPSWTGPTWQTGVAVKNGSTKARVLLGTASPATTEIEGYPYVPVVAGTPVGAPTTETGYAPIVIDSAGLKLWAYIDGAWKGATLT